MIGFKFGRLTILSKVEASSLWLCQCDCGTLTKVRTSNLRSGGTKSCGCFQKEKLIKRATHGKTNTVEYSIWKNMLARCRVITHKLYKYYGGRGITVCERWLKFENFLEDMGVRPSKKYSLERRDNSKGYEPNNCYWATRIEQANNTRFNRLITINGETKTVAQWSIKMGVGYSLIAGRLSRGWGEMDAVLTPSNTININKRFLK